MKRKDIRLEPDEEKEKVYEQIGSHIPGISLYGSKKEANRALPWLLFSLGMA